jgi:hypothetical protein
MLETVRIAELTTKIDGIVEWQKQHDKRDDERIGDLGARIEDVTAKVGELFIQRAEQIGAARAIANLAERRTREQQVLAERRGVRQTWIMSSIMAAMAFLTICIQKHWLGL